MVDINFVEILAVKILNKEVNPKTDKPFMIEDIKKEEYKQPVLDRVSELELKKEGETLGNKIRFIK